jgi:beta-lactamase class A
MKLTILSFKNLAKIFVLIIYCTNIHAHTNNSTIDKLKLLEASANGRIGIFAINTQNGNVIAYRANEAFPMGCTSKVMGVSAVLKKSLLDPVLYL